MMTWVMLPQAVRAAEQQSMLRAGRAGEATPVITLPESMLLQSGNGEQDGRVEADAGRGGHGNNLWNSLQDGASEMVEDARAAFFVEATTTAAATTTTAAPPPTTVDPAVIAKQLKITKDAAQARNLLVGMIGRAQIALLGRLNELNVDLDAMGVRARQDLKSVNASVAAAKNMPIMAQNADVDVKKIQTNGDMLKAAIPVLVGRAETHSKLIAHLIQEKTALEGQFDKSQKLPGAKTRIQNNQQTLDALDPRLVKLERKVTKLESRLYDGDLQKMVDDVTDKEVVSVVEDVSRGFGRFVANR